MLFREPIPHFDEIRSSMAKDYRSDEMEYVAKLIAAAAIDFNTEKNITARATQLVSQVREQRIGGSGVDSLLNQYDLSSEEGIALMCLAEALLRVPDTATIDDLIRDKLSGLDWKSHLGQSDSFFVNAATWALMLTGSVLHQDTSASLGNSLKRFLGRTSEPMIRKAVERAMRIMSRQFVMGRNINEALKRAKTKEKNGYRYSYDMLGEAAHTAQDATNYFAAYQAAIISIGNNASQADVYSRASISIKLSALHPRYEFAQRTRVLRELTPRLLELAQLAKAHNIALTVDAEESERLDLSLDVIEQVFLDPSLQDWQGFGMAVQSYQKRAMWVLDWVAALGRKAGKRMMVRLIKGAYWDTEIKQAQMQGLAGYPVFTRKIFTDVSFQACAKKILTLSDAIYPQFATHNAYSVALILELVGDNRDFEFQCLHGMGSELYSQIVPQDKLGIPCRIYAPVGSHEDLLPYLVRRLLENGANSSFVNRIVDAKAPIADLVASPVAKAKQLIKIPSAICLPQDIFGQQRKNSMGIDLNNWLVATELQQQLAKWQQHQWQVGPIINGQMNISNPHPVYSPNKNKQVIGQVQHANADEIEQAISAADAAAPAWDKLGFVQRSEYLMKAADLLQQHQTQLIAILIVEAGKTIADAIGEVREAIDFCRYYAQLATTELAIPQQLKGYTGETNFLELHGRGTMLCISPWNFPLAIFIGQISACLVAGNTVIAKPAEQTPLCAALAIQLLHQAGIPASVLQFLTGSGSKIGGTLVADPRIKGVVFTGSTATACIINKTLANRPGAIVPLIAETGGINAMIVDSSALLEQVVMDVVTSAFGSAGQRCSALRILFIQEDVYEKFASMLTGVMAELKIGDPQYLDTDIGPVIDDEAAQGIIQHIETMQDQAKMIAQASLHAECQAGNFVAPCAFLLNSMAQLTREIFGPVLHVVPFARENLAQVIADINNSNYGLTLGVHSRIGETVHYIQSNVKVGNCYVNRNMIGAVVGLQPFGGEGLSGTGPKAGGPHYLTRLCVERTVTVNTTAAGGNASLMALADEVPQ